MRRFFLYLALGALALTPMSVAPLLAQQATFAIDEVVAVALDDANMRTEPSASAQIVLTLRAGDLVRVADDAPVDADGLTWWNVSSDSFGVIGWMVEDALAPAESTDSLSAQPTRSPSVPTPSIPESATADSSIHLLAVDIAYKPTTIVIQTSDLPVTIVMENTGAAHHSFVIDALDISVETDPGETVEIVIPAGTAPGVYEYFCSVPGHRDGAGMFGALIIEGSSFSTERATQVPQSCDGLVEYQIASERAWRATFDQNPTALTLLLKLDEFEGEDLADLYTATEFLELSSFFADAANALSEIRPPAFASAWHGTQVEQFELLARITKASPESGWLTATQQYEAEIEDNDQEAESALWSANGCEAFIAWVWDYDPFPLAIFELIGADIFP